MIRTLRSVVRFRRFEPNRAKRRLSRAASVADLRELARRRLPAGVFDYIDGAAEDELTMDRNAAAFDHWEFVPRVLAGRVGAGHLGGADGPAPSIAAGAVAHRVHPHCVPRWGAGRGPGRGPQGDRLLAVHAEHPVDRGDQGGERRPVVVPALLLARPGVGGRMAPAGRRLRLRGSAGGGGHAGVRPPGAGRAPGLHPAAHAGARHGVGRAAPTGLDVVAAAVRSDHLRQPDRGAGLRRQQRAGPGRVRPQPVQPGALVGRPGLAARALDRKASPQGRPVGGRCPNGCRAGGRRGDPVQPRRAANSTAHPPS